MSEAKTYQGAPCKRGHDGLRYKRNRACVKCGAERSLRYYHANAEKCREAASRRHAGNPTTTRERSRRWREANPEKVRARNEQYRRENREKHLEARRQWAMSAPYKDAARVQKRHAAKLNAAPGWLSEDDLWLIEQFYEMAALRSQMTGVKHHVDHIVPLQGKTARGLHVPWNLQIIPASENIRKGNRLAA